MQYYEITCTNEGFFIYQRGMPEIITNDLDVVAKTILSLEAGQRIAEIYYLDFKHRFLVDKKFPIRINVCDNPFQHGSNIINNFTEDFGDSPACDEKRKKDFYQS